MCLDFNKSTEKLAESSHIITTLNSKSTEERHEITDNNRKLETKIRSIFHPIPTYSNNYYYTIDTERHNLPY